MEAGSKGEGLLGALKSSSESFLHPHPYPSPPGLVCGASSAVRPPVLARRQGPQRGLAQGPRRMPRETGLWLLLGSSARDGKRKPEARR